MAIEQNDLSGIYVVVKYERSDVMAETLNKIMDFVGDDGVRIIITHNDSPRQEETGANLEDTKQRLAELVDVELGHIVAIGKQTPKEEIENFIASTLHAPRRLEVTKVQLASVADLTVGARKFHKTIDEISAKIEAASMACRELSKANHVRERDAAIQLTKNLTETMLVESKISISASAQELTLEQRHALQQQINLSVSLPLEAFLQSFAGHTRSAETIGIGDWNKRKCTRSYAAPSLKVQFSRDEEASTWRVQYLVDGVEVLNVEQVPKKLQEKKATQGPPIAVAPKRHRQQQRNNGKAFTSNGKRTVSKPQKPGVVGQKSQACIVPQSDQFPTASNAHARQAIRHRVAAPTAAKAEVAATSTFDDQEDNVPPHPREAPTEEEKELNRSWCRSIVACMYSMMCPCLKGCAILIPKDTRSSATEAYDTPRTRGKE